ncbi:MAG: hypothetical protein ACHQ01_11110 [Candidatus Limnocylindrales bacterium]
MAFMMAIADAGRGSGLRRIGMLPPPPLCVIDELAERKRRVGRS